MPETNPEAVELEPCPCCNAPGYLLLDRRTLTFKVKCTGCELQTKPILYSNAAIDVWNTRLSARTPSAGAGDMRKDSAVTAAAGRIMDVFMGGHTGWRERMDESCILESADWAHAVRLAQAALTARTGVSEAVTQAIMAEVEADQSIDTDTCCRIYQAIKRASAKL